MSMVDPKSSFDSGDEQAREFLEEIEARIARIESHLGLPATGVSPAPTAAAAAEDVHRTEPPQAESATPGLEIRIGAFGLAWIGSAILLLGIVFLMTYTSNLGLPIVSSIVGYLAVVGLYMFARVWKESIPHIYRINYISSLLLLYYSTMRLHFFSQDPFIGSVYLAFLLLLLVVGFMLYLALVHDSQSLGVIAVLLGLIAALLIDRTHIGLPLIAVFSGISLYLAIRRNWWNLLIVVTPLAYMAYVLWLLGNPIAGHPLGAVSDHQNSLIYVFLYAAVFSWPMLFFSKESETDPYSIALVLFNSLGFAFASSVFVLVHFQERFAGIFLAIACFALLSSMVLWWKTHQQFAPSVYAGFGFVALSIALFGYAGVPTAFLWLALESLLVVSMALWFQSKILVVANSFIFLAILLAYIVSSPSVTGVNFSFAFVALLSARVMNWQRERLTLHTDKLRNLYLVIAFIFMLRALHGAVPNQLVTLTWTAAAAGYFLVSLLLKNIKYRWMAILTMLVTVVYLLFVDLARLDLLYRVLAFLFLGLIAIGISLFYARFKQHLSRENS